MESILKHYLDESLKRWGFSFRSFSNAFWSFGSANFSISSILSCESGLNGRSLSSNGFLKFWEFLLNILRWFERQVETRDEEDSIKVRLWSIRSMLLNNYFIKELSKLNRMGIKDGLNNDL